MNLIAEMLTAPVPEYTFFPKDFGHKKKKAPHVGP